MNTLEDHTMAAENLAICVVYLEISDLFIILFYFPIQLLINEDYCKSCIALKGGET